MSQQGDLFKHVEEARSVEEIKTLLIDLLEEVRFQRELLERIDAKVEQMTGEKIIEAIDRSEPVEEEADQF